MKKTIVTLAVLVMASGTVGLAQTGKDLSKAHEIAMRQHLGTRDEFIKPLQAICDDNGEKYRVSYTYDEYDYYRIEEQYEAMNGNTWETVMLINYEYGFSGNILEIVAQTCDDGVWEYSSRATYTYDGALVDNIVYEVWENNAWTNYKKEIYNYNADITTIIFREWENGIWAIKDLHTYTTTPNSIEILRQYMQNGAWQNETKTTKTLDFAGKVTQQLDEEWINNAWANDELAVYDYEDDLCVSVLISNWTNGVWREDNKISYDYLDGNATHAEYFQLNTSGVWVPASGEIEMFYDNGEASDVYDASVVDVEYFDVTNLNENTSAASFVMHPVPAMTEVYIEADDFAKAEIYGLNGQKVLESSQSTVNVAELPSGLYLIKVYGHQGQSRTQRFVVK